LYTCKLAHSLLIRVAVDKWPMKNQLSVKGIVMRFDPERKFVRVNELRPDGFIDFDFAIGEPDLYVEMILPAGAFDNFCEMNKVEFITEAPSDLNGDWWWRLRNATDRRFNF